MAISSLASALLIWTQELWTKSEYVLVRVSNCCNNPRRGVTFKMRGNLVTCGVSFPCLQNGPSGQAVTYYVVFWSILLLLRKLWIKTVLLSVFAFALFGSEASDDWLGEMWVLSITRFNAWMPPFGLDTAVKACVIGRKFSLVAWGFKLCRFLYARGRILNEYIWGLLRKLQSRWTTSISILSSLSQE
jgi:hypothetical protein